MLKFKTGYLIVATSVALLFSGFSSAATSFDFQNVTQLAKELAQKPYKAPTAIPAALSKLSYDEYRQVRFLPQHSLWQKSDTNLQVRLIAPGLNYKYPVKINIVDAAGVHPLAFHKDWFAWPDKLAGKLPDKLGYAGFKLTFPLNAPDARNQFLVFAGASYFRGVAKDQRFGLSARGLAINTGLPTGEEFPSFTRFWLVRPSPDAQGMKFYALLNSKSLTGAYQFTVYPGAPTRIKVRTHLFIRKPVKLLGLAPLTSMFYYAANTPRPQGAWRPAAHDSGGLLIHNGTGEWLWQPLLNPISLQLDYFSVDHIKGFGLMQRNTHFSDYEDSETRYDLRPSAWVTPKGDWGPGHVVLVQIPTKTETNDNIVAFWSPQKEPKAGAEYQLDYSLTFGTPDIPDEAMAQATTTLIGSRHSAAKKTPDGALRVVVDFAGKALEELPPDAKIDAVVTGLDGTKVLKKSVQAVKSPDLWRLSMLVLPPPKKPLRLRAYLKQGDQTLSETWTYSLPVNNRFTNND